MQFESALCVRFIRLSLHARKTHVRRGLAASFVGTGISPCCRVSAPTPAAATVASASTATTAAVADAITAATTAAVAVARHARGVSTSWPPCIAPATTVPLLGLSCGREPAHAGLGRQHCDAGARRARSRAGSGGGRGSGGGGSAARKHGAAAGPAPPPPPHHVPPAGEATHTHRAFPRTRCGERGRMSRTRPEHHSRAGARGAERLEAQHDARARAR